jgi:hypothetical protein
MEANMAGENSPSDNRYYIKGVEALYPRINQPYRFDREKGKKGLTVPCNASDDQAAYEMSVRMSKEKAVPLYKAMKEEYARRGMAGWPALPKYSEVFEIDSDGMFIAKTKLKAMYDNKAVNPPIQFDSMNVTFPDDFMLTSGSIVTVMVQLVPYSMATSGVSLRLRQVQVNKLEAMKDRSAFDVFEGGYTQSEGFGFASADEEDAGAAPAVAVEFDAPKPQPVPVDDNDIDDALENLDFDD